MLSSLPDVAGTVYAYQPYDREVRNVRDPPGERSHQGYQCQGD
jgi:hypothetical protein